MGGNRLDRWQDRLYPESLRQWVGNELDADRRGAGVGGGARPDASHEESALQRERGRSGDPRAHRLASCRCRPDFELHPRAARDEG